MNHSQDDLRELSPQQKRLILARLLNGQGSNPTFEEHPLSWGQRALWLLHQLSPESSAYHIVFPARVRSAVDVGVLEQTFQRIVHRHAALRTTFPADDTGPRQRVYARMVVDFLALSVAADGADLDERVRAEARRPFDLAGGPLFRVRLFSRDKDDHVLLLVLHHIVGDGVWSLAVLLDELRQVYPALAVGLEPALLAPGPPYTDFVRWQAQMLAGLEGEAHWFYWQQRLAGELPSLTLPTDFVRPLAGEPEGAAFGFTLAPSLATGVRALAREAGTTLYATLLAAFYVLLLRTTGQRDLLIGSPMAGRGRPEFAEVIGYFVNSVVLRTTIAPGATFLDLLAEVRTTVLGALEHQDFPFALLVERLQPVREPGRTPLFQVSFAFQKLQRLEELSAFFLPGAACSVAFGGLRLEPYPLSQQDDQFELSLEWGEVDGNLAAVFHYDTRLFRPETIARLADHLRTLLAAAVANPSLPVERLPLLSERELAALAAWNSTDCPLAPADATLHQLVLQQAQRTPDAPAVRFHAHCLSYSQLAHLSERLAARLLALGARPDRPVAVLLPRALLLPVALLAVLRTGSFYLPLDPELPAARVRLLLTDAQPALLVTLAELLPPELALPVLLLDRDDWQSTPSAPLPAVPVLQAANLLYTSGSTGSPKGVLNCHRALVNRLLWMQQTYPLTPTDRVLHKTPLSFDVSGWELWWPLLVGAQLVIAPPGVHTDPGALLTCIAQTGATVIHFVPAMLALVNAEPRLSAQATSLRLVFASGEALGLTLAAQFAQHLPGTQLHNLYGPTEAAIDVSYQDALAEGFEGCRTVPIGRPIANVQLHVLDERMQPVAVGVAGEIYIGGVGLALGYWQRPDLTAERFVPDPSGPAGSRLYRTGDQGRRLADGRIEYLGRLDSQVKLRGVRIEPGEVEAHLQREPGVRQAAAVVSGEQLVGFVVGEVEGEAIRRSLRERLPEAMVPGWVTVVGQMPTTASGKVDRRVLVEWAAGKLAGRREAAREHGQARTPVEAAVARVWCEVLGLESVGVEEDFFALGGHSLLAARAIARLRAELAVDVSLRSFFASPTVAGLAQHVTTIRATGETRGPSLVPAPRHGPLPASFAQERMWFIEQMTPGNPAYNISGAMLLEGTLDVDALVRTFSEIVRRHEVLRTTYAWQDGQLVQIVQPPRSLPLNHVDLSELADSEQEDAARQVVLAEAATPLDLRRDVPLRVTLVHLGNERRVVVLVMHHIASDGWSLEVVFREVAALYAAFVARRPSPLPALPVQYADYALWQRQRLSEQALAAPLAYWHRQLADLAVLALPTDRPRPAVASLRGAMCECAIARPCVDALNAFAREEGATLFMVLLAAFQTLLHRYTGQDDIAVGTPVAGRTEAATEPLIGLFVNSLVLRGDLSGNPSFRTLLGRTRESVLDADAHQEVPFEKLVEILQPQREPGRHPLFQVFFVYNNISTSPIEMPGLKLATFEDNSGYQQTAKFDLELAAVHGPAGLRLVLNYSTDLFEKNTVNQMLEHLQELLAFLPKQPDHNLLDIPLSRTRHQLQEVTVDDFADDDQFAFE